MSRPTPEEIYERCFDEHRSPEAFIDALAQYGYRIVSGSLPVTSIQVHPVPRPEVFGQQLRQEMRQ